MKTKLTSPETLEISCPVCSNKKISPKYNKKNPSDFGCKNLEKYSMFSCPNCYCEFCYPREPLIYENLSTDACGLYRSFVSKEEFEGRLYHTLNGTAHFKDSPYVYNILSLLNFRGNFLDFGAGSGYMTELARRLGYKVSAVEESRGAREFIKEIISEVEVYVAIQELEGRKKKFDVVSTMHVIEHVPYPVEVLKNIHSILSPEGILIVVVPNLDRAYYRFGEVGKEIEDLIDWNGISNGYCASDFPPHHLTRFKTETIKKALKLSGFRNVAIGYSPLNAWDLFYTGLGDDTFRFKDYFNDIVRMKSIALVERRLNEMLTYLNLGNLGWSLIALASDKWEKSYLENLIRQSRQQVMDTYVNTIVHQYEEFKQGTIKTIAIDKSADEKDILILNLKNELKQIYGSHGWKALKIYYQLRTRIFPTGSKRKKFVKRNLKVILMIFRKCWLYFHTAILRTIYEYKRDRKFLTEHGNKELLPYPSPYLRFRVTGFYSLEHFHNSGLASRRAFANALKKVGKNFADFNSILDFGCGCGRIMRWMKDVSQYSQLYGIDIDKPAIRWCQKKLKFARFSINNPLPPTKFQSNKFDLIFSNSVLTHLDNSYQDQWLEELKRVARPGAYILMTVNGEHAWKQFYDTAPDNPAMKNYRDAFLKDGYLYVSNDNWADIFPDFYHSMFHSYEYIHQHWADFFDVKDYMPRAMLEYQDIVVMYKTE